MVFRSRISIAIILFVAVMSFTSILFRESRYVNIPSGYEGYAITGGVLLLFVLILFGIRYEITQTELRIKLGPLRMGTIKLNDIKSIKRSYNPLSSPAASLKRLVVNAPRFNALISPANEEEFLRLIKKRNPSVEIEVTNKTDWYRFWDWDL